MGFGDGGQSWGAFQFFTDAVSQAQQRPEPNNEGGSRAKVGLRTKVGLTRDLTVVIVRDDHNTTPCIAQA